MSADPSQSLLFGLLALQSNLIDQAQLVLAFHSWTREKGRSLADHLEAQGALASEDRALVEALVARHLQKHGGDTEQSLRAVQVDSRTRTQLLGLADPDIDATIGHVSGGAAQTAPTPSSDETLPLPSASPLNGRFRVLRPHARGGLGEVLVALDEELHREVALKQILEHHADDPASRTRFVLEAEITGGLEHPGIVPVYGLGRHPDGRPYYAMRFVRGETLKETIDGWHANLAGGQDERERTLELQKLLRRFLEVCNAVEYAHSRGVIHRDIKPANVVLGPHGETLLVDWGLAKAVGRTDPKPGSEERTLMPSSASGSADTLPGTAMGTPAYMSPEQAVGDVDLVSQRSDVYSLGATLYYILAGKPPFAGNVPDILRAVQRGEWTTPRRVTYWVSPALEAICIKAMALKPEDRYPSARALASDIECWMADQPVAAYREPFQDRLSRWGRRNRNLVQGAVVLLAVVAVGAVLVASAIAEQRKASEEARLRANDLAADAERSYQVMFTTLQRMSTEISDQALSQVPGATAQRLAIAKTAADIIAPLISQQTSDPAVLKMASRVCSDAAYSLGSVGKISDAIRRFKESIRMLELRVRVQTSNSTLSDPDIDLLNSATCTYLYFLIDRGLDEDQVYRFREELDRVRVSADELASRGQPNVPFEAWRFSCAGRVDLIEAIHLRSLGQIDQSRSLFVRAIERFRAAWTPGVWFWNRLYLAQAHRGLALIEEEKGHRDEAERLFSEALKLIREVTKNQSGQVDPPYVLAWTLVMNGQRLARDPARVAESTLAFDEARKITAKLVADFPIETRYSRLESILQFESGRALLKQRRFDQAEKELQAAIAGYTRVLDPAVEPDNLESKLVLGRAERALGEHYLDQGRQEVGLKLLQQAKKHLEEIANSRPGNVLRRENFDAVVARLEAEARKAAASPR